MPKQHEGRMAARLAFSLGGNVRPHLCWVFGSNAARRRPNPSSARRRSMAPDISCRPTRARAPAAGASVPLNLPVALAMGVSHGEKDQRSCHCAVVGEPQSTAPSEARAEIVTVGELQLARCTEIECEDFTFRVRSRLCSNIQCSGNHYRHQCDGITSTAKWGIVVMISFRDSSSEARPTKRGVRTGRSRGAGYRVAAYPPAGSNQA
jgi:hypothetical protein